MKISQQLPQCSSGNSLIAAVARQEGKFYLCRDGIIKELSSFKFAKPESEYTDREGFFENRGNGRVYRSGAVYEPKRQRTEDLLIENLKKNIKNVLLKSNIDSIYVLSPEYLKNLVKKVFYSMIKKNIKIFIAGNFCHSHPFKLLEKIKEELAPYQELVPARMSALKIMLKPRIRKNY